MAMEKSFYMSLNLKTVLILASSADSDEIPHS